MRSTPWLSQQLLAVSGDSDQPGCPARALTPHGSVWVPTASLGECYPSANGGVSGVFVCTQECRSCVHVSCVCTGVFACAYVHFWTRMHVCMCT